VQRAYCELASTAAQFPFVLETAVRTALETRGVAVLVVPGDVLVAEIGRPRVIAAIRATAPVVRPSDREQDVAAGALDAAERVTILVDVLTARQELSLPPAITFAEVKGFALYATRSVLSGRGDELIDLAKTNVTRRLFS
jgi:thiamine pyrophosphate-dependent acetolactate synthase large subunit-like protein